MQLKIAEITISLFSDHPELEVDVPLIYTPFLSNCEPDVRLTVKMGLPNLSDTATLIFHTDGNWSLYRENGDYFIPVCFPPGADPWLIAKMDSDFCNGEIFVTGNRTIPPHFFPLEYPLDELLMINLLARGKGVLLHACAIKDGDKGILFAGTSGAGKSTTANLWQDIPGVTLLSDDRVILRRYDNRFWIYGTPWHGDARAASPEAVELDRIFILNQASLNNVIPLRPLDAASRLLVRAFPTFWDTDGMQFTMNFLSDLVQTAPCFQLDFLPDPSAVEYIQEITAN